MFLYEEAKQSARVETMNSRSPRKHKSLVTDVPSVQFKAMYGYYKNECYNTGMANCLPDLWQFHREISLSSLSSAVAGSTADLSPVSRFKVADGRLIIVIEARNFSSGRRERPGHLYWRSDSPFQFVECQ